MSGYQLKPMTDTSWILHKDGVRVALITSKDTGLVAIGKLGKNSFTDVDDLARYLGGKVDIETPVEDPVDDEVSDINGYPTKHQGVVEVPSQAGLPVYKRGKTEHSAGYYGVKFSHGWVTSYCPRLSTLTENEYIGPFRTKLEMLNAISQKKRAIQL